MPMVAMGFASRSTDRVRERYERLQLAIWVNPSRDQVSPARRSMLRPRGL
jgi:hypothetical protein